MKCQFVKVTTNMKNVVWLNVSNIVEVKKSSVAGYIAITVNSTCSDGSSDVYTVHGSVEGFFATLGIKPISFE